MNRAHFVARAVAVLVGVMYYAAGSSQLLGSPDPLVGIKTALYILSAAGVIGFVSWLNRRDERP